MRFFGLFVISALMFMAGCQSTGKVETFDWGPAYEDVSVPGNFEPLKSKPFVRRKRSYGKYSYKSTDGLLRPNKVSAWFKAELAKNGWEYQADEIDDPKGLMYLKYIKGEDRLSIKLNPDKRISANERYSVLTIEMNSQYD